MIGSAWAWACSTVCLLLVVFDGPTEWLRKEGPAEHLQHLLLAALVLASAALAAGRGERTLWAIPLYALLLLGEELDWGGLWLGGGGNLHTRGHLYFLFGLPLAFAFTPSLRSRTSPMRALLGPATPSRSETLALFVAVLALPALASALRPAWELPLDEAKELALYGLLLGVVLRAHRGGESHRSETAQSLG